MYFLLSLTDGARVTIPSSFPLPSPIAPNLFKQHHILKNCHSVYRQSRPHSSAGALSAGLTFFGVSPKAPPLWALGPTLHQPLPNTHPHALHLPNSTVAPVQSDLHFGPSYPVKPVYQSTRRNASVYIGKHRRRHFQNFHFRRFDYFSNCLLQVDPNGLTTGSKVQVGPNGVCYYWEL